MIDDPYTVGIRLALEDGVTAGLGVIRDQLTALDRTISATARRLEELRTSSVAADLDKTLRAASLVTPQSPRKPDPAETAQRIEPTPPRISPAQSATPVIRDVAAAVSTPASAPPGPAVPPTSSVPRPSAPATAPMPVAAEVPPPFTPAALPPPAMKAPSTPSSAPQITRAPSTAAASSAPPPTAAPRQPDALIAQAMTGSPIVAVQPAAPPAALKPAIAAAAPVVQVALEAAAPVTAAPPAKGLQPPPAAPTNIVKWIHHSTQHVKAQSPVSHVAIQTAPKYPTPASIPPQPIVAAPGAATPSSSYAPPTPSGPGGGPITGDVFLDGARVGRWMSTHLAKEAARPPSGSTAFDPRLGLAWPGALQGN